MCFGNVIEIIIRGAMVYDLMLVQIYCGWM